MIQFLSSFSILLVIRNETLRKGMSGGREIAFCLWLVHSSPDLGKAFLESVGYIRRQWLNCSQSRWRVGAENNRAYVQFVPH